MSKDNDFKSITVAFSQKNEDAKEKLKSLTEKTGKSKIDIICEALRQYEPNKEINQENESKINKQEIEEIVERRVKEILGAMLLNNLSLNANPINIQPHDTVKTEKYQEEIEKKKLQELNKKKIHMSLLDDDD